MFLHSPVMGEVKNAMQNTHTHAKTRTHTVHSYGCKHTYICVHLNRQGSHNTLPELFGVDIVRCLKGPYIKKDWLAVKSRVWQGVILGCSCRAACAEM